MPGTRIALLADGHLTRHDQARLDVLVRALEKLGERCAAVYILGDLFEVWLGLATREPHVERVGAALRALRRAGVRTGYLEGNRDFAIGRGATAGLFDVVAKRELVERFGNATFHLSHGDLVNEEDLPYRAWRAVAKSVLAPAALRLMPDRWSIRLAERIEVRLRGTNRRHKSRFPEAQCLAWARRRVAAGASVVAVGHFHHEWVVPIEADGRSGTFVSLPFWHDEPRPVFFDAEGRIADPG